MEIPQPAVCSSIAHVAISALLVMTAGACGSDDDGAVVPKTVSASTPPTPATAPSPPTASPPTASSAPATDPVPSGNITLPSVSVPDSAASQLDAIDADLDQLEAVVPTTDRAISTESTQPADALCAHPAENREQLTAFAAETVDGLMGELVLAQLADIQDWEAACKRSDADAAAVLAKNIAQRGKLIRERRDEVG